MIYLGQTLVKLCGNGLKYADLHGHIIYQNDPMAKPDFIVMVPELYRRRCRRQARRRLHSLPPEPQGHLENDFAYQRGGLKLAGPLIALL